MRVIAVIDDPRVTEKVLRHLGAWHDPPTMVHRYHKIVLALLSVVSRIKT
jgi:hypothetical protein